jgi:hypothetical protein
MLSVDILIDITQNVVVMIVIMLSVITLSVIMMSAIILRFMEREIVGAGLTSFPPGPDVIKPFTTVIHKSQEL